MGEQVLDGAAGMSRIAAVPIRQSSRILTVTGELPAPGFLRGQWCVPVASLGLRTRYEVTIVAFKRRDGTRWDIADRDVAFYADDEILVAGSPKKAEAFSELDKDADA